MQRIKGFLVSLSRKKTKSPVCILPGLFHQFCSAIQSFNPYDLQKNQKVFVSAKLLVEIQSMSEQGAQWRNVSINGNFLNSFKEKLRRDLTATYYNYLIERYDVKMKSSGKGETHD